MTYNAFETSTESGDPVELYRFTVGLTTFLRTSADDDFVVDAPDPFQGTYISEPIKRGKVGQSGGKARSGSLDVIMPATDEIVTRFISIPPGERMELTIVRIHRSDPDEETITYWQGRCLSIAFMQEAREAKLLIETLAIESDRTIPRFTYSVTCNHTHYDSRCKVDKEAAAFKKNLAITGQSGNIYTATGAGAFGADFFVAGYMEFNGDFRSILAQDGDDLTVILPFAASPVGSSIDIRAGCKLRVSEDCDVKFGNKENNGSFSYVPKKNPFEGLD